MLSVAKDTIKYRAGADQAQKRLNDSMTDFNAILRRSGNIYGHCSPLEKTTADEGHRKPSTTINTTYGKYLPNLLSEKKLTE